MSSMSTLVSMW